MWFRVIAVWPGDDIISRVSRRATTETDSGLAARLAATASFGAAVVHFAVVPSHWNEWMPSGLFFVSIALFQLIWARVLLTRTTTAVLAAGILGNAGAAVLWLLSRTVGAPFGPHAGLPELVQGADLCALLLEVYVVMGAGWVWRRGRRVAPIPAFANAIVLLGLGAVIASAATVGVASSLQGGHHGPAAAEPEHHTPTIGYGDGHHDHPAPATPLNAESHRPPDTAAPVEAPLRAVDPSHPTDGDQHHHE
jgi:hypothetical protein